MSSTNDDLPPEVQAYIEECREEAAAASEKTLDELIAVARGPERATRLPVSDAAQLDAIGAEVEQRMAAEGGWRVD